MTLLDEARTWLLEIPGIDAYEFSAGGWTEDPTTGRILSVAVNGGRYAAEERYPVIRVVLNGRRGTRSDVTEVLQLAQDIEDAAMGSGCTGRAVRVSPVGGIVGPGYTAEGRPWAEISLEFLI